MYEPKRWRVYKRELERGGECIREKAECLAVGYINEFENLVSLGLDAAERGDCNRAVNIYPVIERMMLVGEDVYGILDACYFDDLATDVYDAIREANRAQNRMWWLCPLYGYPYPRYPF